MTTIKTEPVLFLFDSDHPQAGGAYGYKFDSSFLCALKSVDRMKATRSLVMRGDLLLTSLCYKPSRVFTTKSRKVKRIDIRSRSSGIEKHADMDFFMLLIGDISNAFESQWHTLNLVELPELLMHRHTLYCIFVPSFPSKCRVSMDSHLRKHACYLGAVVPDLSNPLQRELMVNSLFRDAFIEKGAVYMPLGIEGYLDGDFYGANEFSQQGIIALSAEEFSKRFPAILIPEKLSERAMITAMRLKNRGTLNVHQRLASGLSSRARGEDLSIEFDWDLKQLPSAPDEVEVQARKIIEYLLNPLHEKGKSKAIFFERALGIVTGDWRFLQGQFIDALSKASFEDIRVDSHGIRFSASLTIQGRNGQTAVVNTAWIVEPLKRARLVTAHPGNKGITSYANSESLEVVSPDLRGNERWQALFDMARRAGERAESECVPTPMKIQGGELFMEGECGGAYVVVPDARKGFARWLKTSGNGDRDHYHGGTAFSAETNSQSVDRATAYAEAFAKALRRNGVECKVERYLT
ncbi:MAG: hypothetical protein O3A85_14095 [Proteobacteria bacterium]|nr:hypothetical protein [Pseudomonadota bacterium]